MAQKKQFDCAIEAIEYYWLLRPPIPIESIFFLLTELSLLVGSPTDLNYTENKSYSKNNNISDEINISNKVNIGDEVDDKIFCADGLPLIDLNQTKSERYIDHCDMYDTMDKEIIFTKEIQSNYLKLNCSKGKYHSNSTIDSNCNIQNELNYKKLWLDNFKNPK